VHSVQFHSFEFSKRACSVVVCYRSSSFVYASINSCLD